MTNPSFPSLKLRFTAPHLTAFLLTAVLSTATLTQQVEAYPLSAEQEARLKTYLPATYARLQRRSPVKFAIVGDGVSRMITYDEHREDLLHSLNAHLLRGFEAEFYYTGGVRLINPVGNKPQKVRDHMGNELIMEQFTEPGATSLSALQQLTTRALLNDPNVVIIQYGINDLLNAQDTRAYVQALEDAVNYCKEKEVEVIVSAPTLVRLSPAPSAWGVTRRYAALAADVAQRLNVLFVDPGVPLCEVAGAPPDGDPETKARRVSDYLGMRLFDYGPDQMENIFMNSEAHRIAGRGIWDQVLDGVPEADWGLETTASLVDPETIRVDVTLTNNSVEPRSGILTALDSGLALVPEQPYQEVDLEPGGSQPYSINYKRRVQRVVEDQPVHFPLNWNLSWLPISFLMSDGDRTQLVEARPAVLPVKVNWKLTALTGQDARFPLEFNLVNSSDQTRAGTYELVYANQRAKGSFQLGAGETRGFAAQCKLPADNAVMRSRDPVRLTLECDGATFVFDHTIEATREITPGQTVPLFRVGPEEDSTPGEGANMRVTADNDGLMIVVETSEIGIQQAQQQASVTLDLTLDARPQAEVNTFGFVAPVSITFGPEDGVGTTQSIPTAAFGNGYDKELSPEGIASAMETVGQGRKRFTVRVPRSYLYRHEWLMDGQHPLGIGVSLSFLRMNRETGEFGRPDSARWVNADGGLHVNNANRLVPLTPGRSTGRTWSVRLD